MNNTEKYNHLVDGQYGRRKGRMTMDLLDCDSAAYYNFIMPAMSSIVKTDAGTPERESITFIRILKQMN
eukprot:7057599-Ditylum_brightwellii.AAC.1